MGVLILLGTILFVGALIAASVLFVIVGKLSLLKYTVAACVVWFAVYALLLFGVSFSSSERVLPLHEAKRFCGFYLDCHMAAEVSSVRKEKTFKGRTAKGMFLIVGIEVSSDARQAELHLISPRFQVLEGLKRYDPIKDLGTPTDQLEKRIGPNERIRGELVFDVPASAKNLRLDVRSADPIDIAFESILIGDEDSLLHKRTYFSLEPGESQAGL